MLSRLQEFNGKGSIAKTSVFFVHKYITTNSCLSQEEVASLLKSLQAAMFQRRFEQIRQDNQVLPWHTLLQECADSSDHICPSEAERICNALHSAGLIIKAGDVVYLHPKDITTALTDVLPHQPTLLREKLHILDSKIAILETEKKNIERKAESRSRLAGYAGFALLLAQWGILFRLTYWEFSWDVMEPIGFFVGGGTAILSYAWFLQTNRDFSYSDAHQRFMSSWERRAFERAGFDIDLYNTLRREADRYRSLLNIHGH